MDLGKTALPENEIYGSWIKTLDPKQKSLFQCTFLLFLRVHLQTIVYRYGLRNFVFCTSESKYM